MRSILRFSTVRTMVSAAAMVALLACGTWLILSKVIDRVAARHVADLARTAALPLRSGLFEGDRGGTILAVPTAALSERQALDRDFALGFVELLFMLACSFGAPAAVVLWRGWQQRRSDEHISFLVRHDAATGLLNRPQFMQRLDDALSTAAAAGHATVVQVVNLDRFTTVNDRLGAAGADGLIRAVADRLRQAAGPTDILGRLEGDAFVIARIAVQDARAAEATAHGLRARLAQPFRLGPETVSVTASIGVSQAPGDGADAGALLHAADTAMRQAKSDGRDAVRIYEPGLHAALQKRRAIEEAVQGAARDNGFVLHYQPILAARTETLIGFEALLRLPLPGGRSIPPAEFIPVAEEMGLIDRIGGWVLDEACKAAATWPSHLSVAVNLSPRQLETGAICGVVGRALVGAGLAASRLELELTESVLLQETDEVIAQLTRLTALGVSIAMDDFGTGYSSLSNLWRFPFDKLKIDRSFIADLGAEDEDRLDILRTIVSLGRSLKLKVTAEGVETASQADILNALGCDELQGFHYGRPAPEPELARLVQPGAFRPAARRSAYVFKGRFGAFAA